MILIIDNYDSFTYNLVQYYRQFSNTVMVLRNDQATLADIEKLVPSLIVLSPGPGTPSNSGICTEVIDHFHQTTPIFGVCLGMQVIVEFFGGSIIKAHEPIHGKTSKIIHDEKGVFQGIPPEISVTRYHSLMADKKSFPDEHLQITATSKDETVMGVRHKKLPIEGIQFHPEAILTDYGFKMVKQSYLNAIPTL